MRKILRRESRNWSGASLARVYFSSQLKDSRHEAISTSEASYEQWRIQSKCVPDLQGAALGLVSLSMPLFVTYWLLYNYVLLHPGSSIAATPTSDSKQDRRNYLTTLGQVLSMIWPKLGYHKADF